MYSERSRLQHVASGYEDVLALAARRFELLRGRRSANECGGEDIDVAISGLDPTWPLRLPAGWRLCQQLDYDVTASQWIFDRQGTVLTLDTLEDPLGIGRYSLPTAWLFEGIFQAPAVRAAYLTSKRLRKGVTDPDEWKQVSRCGSENEVGYRGALSRMFGRDVARELADAVLNEHVPDTSLRRRCRRSLIARRLVDPRLGMAWTYRSVCRIAHRLCRPTGLTIVVVGPDGTGKSTLTRLLAPACEGLFRRTQTIHWRPGVLPRPGATIGRRPSYTANPHARSLHGRVVSVALLAYYWLDFLLGSWLRLTPFRLRSGLTFVERGWWDLVVDPGRYRLRLSPWLVRLLGYALPKADLILLLEAQPSVIRDRKTELSFHEIERQSAAWRKAMPGRVVCQPLDASIPADDVVARAREVVVGVLEARSTARVSRGWWAIPVGAQPRWWLPRGSRSQAREGLRVYQPITRRARLGWILGSAAAAGGAFRLAPRCSAPPAAVRELVAPYVPPGATYAVARSTHAERFTALVLDRTKGAIAFAKVATSDAGREALRREASVLECLAPLPVPLRAPRVIDYEEGVLVLEAGRPQLRLHPYRLTPEVAAALGAFVRSQGRIHGDFAPWNLLHVGSEWLLVDWEYSRRADPSFHDLWHYLVRCHTLLGVPSLGKLIHGMRGGGWIGAVLQSYAAAAGLDPICADEALHLYLATALSTDISARGDAPAGRLNKLVTALE